MKWFFGRLPPIEQDVRVQVVQELTATPAVGDVVVFTGEATVAFSAGGEVSLEDVRPVRIERIVRK